MLIPLQRAKAVTPLTEMEENEQEPNRMVVLDLSVL